MNDELLTVCPKCGSKNVKSVIHRGVENSQGLKKQEIPTEIDEMVCIDCGHAWIYRRANKEWWKNNSLSRQRKKRKKIERKI